MADIATLGIAVDSRQVKSADRDLNKLTETGKRTEKQTDQIGAAFKRLAAPLAAYLSTRQIAQSAEEWTTLNNRLRLVTDSSAELAAAQDDVFAIAQNSRQPLQAAAELYQRIAQNADELQLNGSGVAAVVDTINKSLAVSGTSGAAANAALIQLGQGFASGTLRGEELNSVLEQAPALAQAIARGMGVAVGDLKRLGEEGSLTARNVIDALLNQADEVDAQFGKIQATAGQAFVTLGNSVTRVVGEIDLATSASAGFADSIIELSQFLDTGALTDSILETFSIWSSTFDAAGSSLSGLGNEIELLQDIGVDAASLVGRAFKEFPLNIRSSVQLATVEIISLVDRAINSVRTLGEAVAAIGTDDTVDAALARGEARYKTLLQVREDSISQILEERQAILDAADADQQRREKERAGRQQAKADREAEIAALRSGAGSVDIQAGAASENAAKAADKARQAIDRQVESLRLQADSFHMTEREAGLYKLQLEGAGPAQLALADAAYQTIEAMEAQEEAFQKQIELMDRADQLRSESLPNEVRALEELQGKYRELAEAVEAGVISQEEAAKTAGGLAERWQESVDKANEKTEEMSEFAKQAARNMQDAFADFLFDPFEDGLDGMLANFGRILQRMAAEAAAAQIFDAIGDWGKANSGSSSGGTSGNGTDWLSTIAGFASMLSFDGGGSTGSGPRTGGLDGRGGFMAMVHPNETIIDHTKGQSAGNSISIGQMVFPGVRTEREAQQASGAAARQLSRVANSGQRYS